MTETKVKIPPEEERFQANLLGMLNALSSIVKYLQSHGIDTVPLILLQGGTGVVQEYDKHKLIRKVIEKSEEYWDKIHSKDEKFFIEKADDVFSFFESSKITVFKT